MKLRYLDPKQKLSRRRSSVRTPPIDALGTPECLKWIEETVPVKPKTPCGMTKIWEHLFGAIRQNRPFPVALDQAIEVMRVITLARKDTAFN